MCKFLTKKFSFLSYNYLLNTTRAVNFTALVCFLSPMANNQSPIAYYALIARYDLVRRRAGHLFASRVCRR